MRSFPKVKRNKTTNAPVHFAKACKAGTPLRLLKHGVCLFKKKKKVDYEADQNNKFLHFGSSSQRSRFDFYPWDIHQFAYLHGTSLENWENSIGMHGALPLFSPLNV